MHRFKTKNKLLGKSAPAYFKSSVVVVNKAVIKLALLADLAVAIYNNSIVKTHQMRSLEPILRFLNLQLQRRR
jgi:hypothetical protein